MSATIAEIIATLKEQFTVTTIVVSHDRDLALTISDRVAILRQGKLLAIDKPDGIRNTNDPLVREFLNPQIDLRNPRFKQLESANE
jgi:phospholipid/cholesterol/gamma-HCH transport system ATP-binding protein